MKYSGFFMVDLQDVDGWQGVAWGIPAASDELLTRGSHSTALTWRGIAIGRRANGSETSGEATITWDPDAGTKGEVAATFRMSTNGSGDMTFSGMTVKTGNVFEKTQGVGGSREYLNGRFYGPGHEEAAGVVGNEHWKGAFGANR